MQGQLSPWLSQRQARSALRLTGQRVQAGGPEVVVLGRRGAEQVLPQHHRGCERGVAQAVGVRGGPLGGGDTGLPPAVLRHVRQAVQVQSGLQLPCLPLHVQLT